MADRRFMLNDLLEAKGLPCASDATLAVLRDIIDEGVLGASNHVALALPLIARIAAEVRETAPDEALETARFIAAVRGAAAPIVANAIAWQTQGLETLSRKAMTAHLSERAERWNVEAKRRRMTLVEKARFHLSQCRTVLVFDYSSTVVDVVRALDEHGILQRIDIPESRSIEGGRRYLEALSASRADLAFLPDAALDWAVGRVDAVLLGAESVTRDGGLINTIGSMIAARAAAAYDMPVYGVADLFKVGSLTAEEIAEPPERSYDFLLPEGIYAMTAAPELEIVPPRLITSILTEAGAVTPADLSANVDGTLSGDQP